MNIYFASFQKSRGGGDVPPPQKNARGDTSPPPGSPPMLPRKGGIGLCIVRIFYVVGPPRVMVKYVHIPEIGGPSLKAP